MFNESHTIPSQPTAIGGMALRCVWNVEADHTYDVGVDTARRASARLRSEGGTGLIAIRTLDGAGRVCLAGDDVYEVRGGSLLLVEWRALRRYHTLGGRWHFWWFEFDVSGPLKMPHHRVMTMPVKPGEKQAFGRILMNLRREDDIRRCLACAQFQTLLYGWLAARTDGAGASSADDRIQAVIEQMYNRLDGTFSVPQMAKMAHVSEPHFRRLFTQVTGTSPKKFYDKLRLTWADHLLRHGNMNVTEVAYALGFSSPFHFSRVFGAHWGYPPSHLRRHSGPGKEPRQ